MAKTTQKKRYTMRDMKKLFGKDFQMPSDEEMLACARKPVELSDILKSLKKQPASTIVKTNSTQELARVRRELQKLMGRIEKIEKNLIAR